MLGYVERALKGFVQAAGRMAMLQGDVIGALELAQNFSFAQHHRVQSAGHLEKVMDTLWLAQVVDFIA